eukprot:g3348.t1
MILPCSCAYHVPRILVNSVLRPQHKLDFQTVCRSYPYPHGSRSSLARNWNSVSASLGGCCSGEEHDHSSSSSHSNGLHSTLSNLTSMFGLAHKLAHLQHQPLGLAIVALGMLLFHSSRQTKLLGGGLVLLFSGFPLFRRSLLRLSLLEIDASVLMSLAAAGSIWLQFSGEGLMLLTLFQFAHLLEDKFTNQSKASLEELLKSAPEKTVVVKMDPVTSHPDMESTVHYPTKEIGVGSSILIKPGEQIPLDGEVIFGTASIIVEHISGESLPIKVNVGSKVPAGSCNIDGLLVLKTLTKLEDSTPWRIAQLAIDAQRKKPKLHRWIDQVMTIWSKCVVLVAMIVAIANVCILKVPLLGPRGALYRALCIVIAAAPCSLVLTPLAYICALANISRRNILIKTEAIFDTLRSCKNIVLDKTGTLTEGRLICTEILNQDDINNNHKQGNSLVGSPKKHRALCHAVDLSKRSSHPISSAIIDAGKQHLQSSDGNCPVSDFTLVPGGGVQGIIVQDSSPPLCASLGSFEFIKEQLGSVQNGHKDLEEAFGVVDQRHYGNSVSVLATHDKDGGNLEWSAFCFRDQLQILTQSAVHALQSGSWKLQKPSPKHAKSLTILTGDNMVSARAVGQALGIDEIYTEVSPAKKQDFVKSLQESSVSGVVMVGDGINDAPALSQANVGISISETASGLSAGAAEIVILNGKGIANLPFLFRLSDKLRSVVVQNLVITFSAMLLACVPAVSGLIPLWLAVIFHEGSSILTAMNSCRLLFVQPDELK